MIALGWLAVGGPAPSGRFADGIGAVEAFCEATGYLRSGFDDQALGAADLLVRLSGSDHYEMGRLLARAVPGVRQVTLLPDMGPALRGSTDSRWSRGGPPEDLLGPSPSLTPLRAPLSACEKHALEKPASRCQSCGRPVDRNGRPGRPATYCSGACRTAAHRARRAEGQ